jgi:hypothetical protein
LPTTLALAGTSAVTTVPAPTIARRPIVRPGSTVALAPIDAPSWISVTRNCSGVSLLRGNRSLANVALGPMKTSSPTRRPSHSCTPHFTVTRSPITTSFSTKTLSQMLASVPMTAPGSTWANAQMREPAPTVVDSQRPCGWTKNDSVTTVLGRSGQWIAGR